MSWTKKISTEQAFFIHLNLGLNEKSGEISINPSVSLRSQALSDLLVECSLIEKKDSKRRSHFGKTLSELAKHSYHFSVEDSPKEIANRIYKDILDYGLPYLEKITDYSYAEKLLIADDPKLWPVGLRSLRARYLPLLLVVLGKESEAMDVLLEMEQDIQGRDQIVPDFGHFKNWFLRRYADQSIQ